ncbi:hypothetical protein [Amycolatopsis sp. CA-230715]|uniref:hypothetical protein n=1 Tax=Amycolatopsis sp. CA-230715 TaxID=2745196 RepID=UPI001C015F9B|nr:hypothetical protein [Amycolatopsis sp. CA-230715]
MTRQDERKRPRLPWLVGTGVLTAATSAGLWWLCRGDDPKHMAPALVGGCVVGLAAITVASATVLPTPVVVLCVAAPFTVAWSMTASASDDSGLWGVGALFLAVGTSAGAALVAAGTKAFRSRQRKRVR